MKRGGQKRLQLPDGATQSRRTDSSQVTALARAFRRNRILEADEFATTIDVGGREDAEFSW